MLLRLLVAGYVLRPREVLWERRMRRSSSERIQQRVARCSCGYSSQINSAAAITRRRLRASSSASVIEEENASKQLGENSAESRSLLLRLLVAGKECRSCAPNKASSNRL
ncbi:hypothetical protein [Evansella halocellulosilytica]|uniref:hypothetical protein n=1 Tax=Evansella halocellulosilytica TaxID=2011013 RepID=UPI0011553567|nr:hypothetical protein [Evansella halocellulosilytica]